jgi:hypothetical protein
MPRLTAIFDITLPEPFLWECQDGDGYDLERRTANDRIFKITVKGFNVEIELADFSGCRKGIVGSAEMAAEITRVFFRVTRDEVESPPIIERTKEGKVDWTPLQEYLCKIDEEYKAIVTRLIEHLSKYFRFQAGHPLVQIHPERGQSRFMNPIWIDQTGKTIWDRVTGIMYGGGFGLRLYPRWNVIAYKPEDRQSLIAALEQPKEQDFYEEILSDAKDAVATGNIRRAVLELAIACEVAIKHVYFEHESFAGSDYSYYEEKGIARARVLDFVDAIAFRTFGHSLKTDDIECFKKLSCLFRCRNKVAHLGTPVFRDDEGLEVTANETFLLEWWSAVKKAIEWLRQYSTHA